MELRTMSDRFRNDAVFHALVKSMENAIESLQLTPSEIRAAAMLAAIHVEARTPFAKLMIREIEEKIEKETRLVALMKAGLI